MKKFAVCFVNLFLSQEGVVEEFYCRNRLWILSVRYLFCLCRRVSTWYRIGYYTRHDIRQRFQVSCLFPWAIGRNFVTVLSWLI